MVSNPLHRVRRNYQGCSFRNQNLAGFDFSDADIRGADFSQANLVGANFTGAIAGLQAHWKLLLTIASTLLSGLFAYLVAFAAFWLAYQLTLDRAKFPTTFSFFVVIVVLFLRITAYRGLLNAIVSIPIAIAVVIPIAGIILPAGSGHPTAGSAGAGIAALSFAGAVGLAISTTSSRIAAGTRATSLSLLGAVIGIAIAVQQARVEGSIANSTQISISPDQIWVAVQMALCAGVALLVIGLYLVWRTAAQDNRYCFITDFAVIFAAIGGTCFRAANLTDASFRQARLKNANFSSANTTRTDWHHAVQLEWANLKDTILAEASIRKLLTLGKSHQTSYVDANLRGANLRGFDLSHVNFRGANLSGATFQGANLEWANLAQTQAIATDFTDARLTGVRGLGTWNIDPSTKLENVDCRWIYLLEEAKPETDDKERRPSSGEFLPGEFTALFQTAIDTVDLIFRNGMQWKPFTQAFQQVQFQHRDFPLEVQSIANKGNGIVVVKVAVPSVIDKHQIHQQFTQFYQEAIALSAKQAQQLEAHEQELQAMRSVVNHLIAQSTSEIVVILSMASGDFKTGFPVTLQILKEESALPVAQRMGQLPPNLQISSCYQQWRSAYRRSLKASRLEVPDQITNVSHAEFFQDCRDAAHRLSLQLNQWLKSESFAAIVREMQIQLSRDRPTRIILQTESEPLRQLPWQAWNFLEDYPKAEIALSALEYQVPQTVLHLVEPHQPKVKILAVLGDRRGINLQADQAALEALDAEITFLVEPQLQCFSEHLWQQHWDILFFAGHSWTDCSVAHLQINATEHLEISQLKIALKAAISHGLRLAIFNSCDGLGLSKLFADLQIPQLILMREPVCDRVAQIFLLNFLKRFSAGYSLHQSVREARERLQEIEEQYPCASWLPVLIQNPSKSSLFWQDLMR